MRKVIAVAAAVLALAVFGAAQMQTGPGSTVPAGGLAATPASGADTNQVMMEMLSQGSFLGSTPSGQATPGVLQLSLLDAIDRGLKYNLGLLLTSAQTEFARGARWRALSDVLPNLNGRVGESFQQINTAQFGFHLPGIPALIGPFGIFDARATMNETFDLHGLNNVRVANENVRASEQNLRNARELVVLAVGATYLQAIAAGARVNAVQAHLNTAETLLRQATDMKKAGVIAGIDVLRAQVERQAEQQRLVAANNDLAKSMLTLGRVIGLPAAQQFALSTKLPYEALPDMTLDEALGRAYKQRNDYQAALSRVRAAESSKRAAQGEALPGLQLSGDYGFLGVSPGSALGTYTLAGGIRIPIFQGGKVRGDVQQAEAALRQRRSEADDLRSRIEYEVRTSFLDVRAAAEQVAVAQEAAQLAAQELQQAQDRFRAGVTGNLELVQAQQAVATAEENYIDTLNAHNIAKLLLARSLGVAEQRVKDYLKGQQ